MMQPAASSSSASPREQRNLLLRHPRAADFEMHSAGYCAYPLRPEGLPPPRAASERIPVDMQQEVSEFLESHFTKDANFTHRVIENYKDWWITNSRPTYKLAIHAENDVERLHSYVAACYDYGLPLTLAEMRTSDTRFVLEVDIWGTEDAYIDPSELLVVDGPFLQTIGCAIRALFPVAEIEPLDVVILDATGVFVTTSVRKTSLRLVWPTIYVNKDRATRVRDHIMERFSRSYHQGVLDLGFWLRSLNEHNKWYNIFWGSIYRVKGSSRMPYCDRVTPAPLKKPENRPFKPLGIWRMACPAIPGSSHVSFERIYGEEHLPRHNWVLAGSIRVDSGTSLTDWTPPESLGNWWHEGTAAADDGSGARRRKRKGKAWDVEAPVVRAPERELGCASPGCTFLVHTSNEFGGFCCRKCHYFYEHPARAAGTKKLHGSMCERAECLGHIPPAAPIPPSEVWRR